MEVEQKNGSDHTVANGNINPAKRGRGRPKGSVNKKITSVTEVKLNARTSKQVDFFSPDTPIRSKVKKRGRPKKIRMPGRPRKVPLTPEEEAERMLRLSKQRKRRISKPLGRPRIHPLVDIPKEKTGRGRQNGAVNRNLKKSLKGISELGEASPRKRGRPKGSFKKKLGTPSIISLLKRANPGMRGRPQGSGTKLSAKQESNGFPRKRGRPPGSGTKKLILQEDGTPRKRGRPPGSGNKGKVLKQEAHESPRKRGRPPGSGKLETFAKETENSDPNRSIDFVSNQPRKRGRPSKASLAEASRVIEDKEGQSEVIDTPLPKRPRNSLGSSEDSNEEGETVADAEYKAGESDAAMTTTSVLPSEGGGKGKNQLEKDSVLVTGNEKNSRKCASSRVVRKAPKKK